MASPFKVFRKHQKLMLALLGVLVMVGFVILPVLMQGMGQRRYVNPRVATTTKYGDLYETNLRSLRWRRYTTRRFFAQLQGAVLEPARIAFQQAQQAREKADQANREVANAGENPDQALVDKAADLGNKAFQRFEDANRLARELQTAAQLIGGTLRRMRIDSDPAGGDSPVGDEALVETWLLAQRAEEIGLVVEVEAVDAFLTDLIDRTNAFLRDLTQGRVASEQFVNILQRLGMRPEDLFLTADKVMAILGRLGISDEDLVSVLRQELLAMRLREMFSVSLGASTPAERWDHFQRLNRKVTVEWLPVQVSGFVNDVPDPDEATLRAFFDAHKNDLDDPASPNPGFREPRKVAIEYLKAEYESFVNREMEAVTPEEAKQYYDENKENYKIEPLPTLDDEEPSTRESEPQAQKPEAAELETSTTEPKTPTPKQAPTGQRPSTDREPSTDPKAATDVPGSEAAKAEPALSAPADQPAQEEQDPSAAGPVEGPEASSSDSDNDTSLLSMTSPFRLASFADAGADADGTEPGETGQPAATSEAPAVEASPEGPALEAPALAQPVVEQKPAEQPTPRPEPPTPPKAEPKVEVEPTEPEAEAAAQPEYRPFEEVEEEIRRQLARSRTPERIETLLKNLRAELGRYHDLLIRYDVDRKSREGGETLTPPPRPDFDQLAKDHGLVAHRTGLISALEVRRLDIGDSSARGQTEFTKRVFDLPEYRPEISQDTSGNYYLFWKVDQAEERVPKLDEKGVRERVVRAWKTIQARTKAKEAAQRLAEEVGRADRSLKDFLSDPSDQSLLDRLGEDLAVTESKPFSWLTQGTIPWSVPWLSEVEGIQSPGHEFMRAVFSLDKGETGTAMNQPQTVVYVVRVTDTNPSPEVLFDKFKNENYWKYFRAADYDRYLAEKAWLEAIKAEAGFQWDPEWQLQPSRSRGG